jgi:O-antigen ligase
VILLAGSRASWLVYALVLLCGGWQRIGRGRVLAVAVAGAVLASLLAFWLSPRFEARIERSLAALSGDARGIDEALSGRLSIWHAAVGMIARTRSTAWAFATSARPIRATPPPTTSSSAAAGRRACTRTRSCSRCSAKPARSASAVADGRRRSRCAPGAGPCRTRAAARPVPAVALAATVFPLNTSLAFYSNFWGGVFLLLLALFAGAVSQSKTTDDDDAPAA